MRSHLGHCTNVHAAETWPEVRAVLEGDVAAVARRLGTPYGVGLRLSNEAATTLLEARALDELRAVLDAHGLYVFTLNGFPYGPFAGCKPVKERVYRPDWLEPERVVYTERLAHVLASILPDGVEGTISTLPVAFLGRTRAADEPRVAYAILRCARSLLRIERETGRSIALAIEPEPFCRLETVSDAIAFFESTLFARDAIATFAIATGLTPAQAESFLRRAIGVCLDACHMAVEWERPRVALRALEGAGIRVAKVQLGVGLRVRLGAGEDPEQILAPFADPVFLHQVVERRDDGRVRRFLDLPLAFADARRDRRSPREWRIHHHVPLHRERIGGVETTRAFLVDLLAALRALPAPPAMEVETYTFGVLPNEVKEVDLVEDLAREVSFVRERLAPNDVASVALAG